MFTDSYDDSEGWTTDGMPEYVQDISRYLPPMPYQSPETLASLPPHIEREWLLRCVDHECWWRRGISGEGLRLIHASFVTLH